MPNFFSPALLIVSVNVPEGKIAEIFQVKLHFPGFGRKKGRRKKGRKLLLKRLGKFFCMMMTTSVAQNGLFTTVVVW